MKHRVLLVVISIVSIFILISCGSSLSNSGNNDSSTSSLQAYEEIRIIPIQKVHNPTEDGWEKFSVNFAFANLFSDWRRVGLSDAYMANITSSASRKESVHWNGSLDGLPFLIPSGFIVRNRIEIKEYWGNLVGKIPQNMTDIELQVPYYEDSWRIGQEIEGYYIFNLYDQDETAYISMDSDFMMPSEFDFPIIDPNLVDAFSPQDEIILDEVNLAITILGHEHRDDIGDNSLVVSVKVQNNSLVEQSEYAILWYGAGSNGLVYGGSLVETTNGGCKSGGNFPDKINLGPSQSDRCSFAFSFPQEVNNRYIWFALTRDHKLFSHALIYLGN
jgi:hypothetical protein